MDTIFDGIQRPLNDIAAMCKDCFIPRFFIGYSSRSARLFEKIMSQRRRYSLFRHIKAVAIHPCELSRGADHQRRRYIWNGILGLTLCNGNLFISFLQVFENEIISQHKIMCPPNVFGEVVKVYGGGTDGKDLFHVDEPVLEVYNEAQNRTHVLNISHFWPVRKPRPCAEKLLANQGEIHRPLKQPTFIALILINYSPYHRLASDRRDLSFCPRRHLCGTRSLRLREDCHLSVLG